MLVYSSSRPSFPPSDQSPRDYRTKTTYLLNTVLFYIGGGFDTART
jgi:hypothetical protein